MAVQGGVRGVDGQTIAGSGLLVRYANFVKLPHTLFALPFALVGVTLGSFRVDVTIPTVGWVVLGVHNHASAKYGNGKPSVVGLFDNVSYPTGG